MAGANKSRPGLSTAGTTFTGETNPRMSISRKTLNILILLFAVSVAAAALYQNSNSSKSTEDGWNGGGIIGVGDGYSVQLLTCCSSPVGMAEYDQKLEVYAGDSRNGKLTGTVDLHPNTGGRTHVKLYTLKGEDGKRRVVLVGNFGDCEVHLETRTVSQGAGTKKTSAVSESIFLGTWSAEAQPFKFIPASVPMEGE